MQVEENKDVQAAPSQGPATSPVDANQPQQLSPEQLKALQEEKAKYLAQLKSELGIQDIELALAEIRNSGKVQPLPGKRDWKGTIDQILGVVAEGMNKFGGSGGGSDSGLTQMLMQDALDWNRMSKAILMRALAKGLGTNLPEHRIV